MKMNEDASEYISHELNKFTCRTCLKNDEIHNSFYDIVNCNGENKELRELYLAVAKIEIIDNDVKPTIICEACTVKLLAAFEFVLNAEKSEEILLHYLVQPDNLIIKKSPTPHDFDFNFVVEDEEEDDDNNIVKIANETEISVDDMDNIETVEHTDQVEEMQEIQKCEDFEVLDEFEFIMEKNNVEEVIIGDPEQVEENDSATTTKTGKVKKSIGSRLSRKTKQNRTHQFNCTDCQRTFAKMQTFQRHIENAHTYAPREEIAKKQINEPTIDCPHCPRNFMHKNDLQRHILAIHPEVKEDTMNNSLNGEVGERGKFKKKYNRGLCPHCGRDFPVASLNIHIRRHLGVNPYQCEQCGKAFPRKQDLTIHERHHSGERPHVCTVCGKSFIRPHKLSRHMRIHLGIRPYKCEECGKAFSQSNDLKIHLRRHSGEKPYHCGICTESFISGTALRVHRKAKSHYESIDNDPDPFINCRVNTRPQANLLKKDNS